MPAGDPPSMTSITCSSPATSSAKLLEAFRSWLEENEPQANIICIDFNELDVSRDIIDGYALAVSCHSDKYCLADHSFRSIRT